MPVRPLPKPVYPTRRQLIAALALAESCMRDVAGEWLEMPSRLRLRLMRCADRAAAVVALARHRSPRTRKAQ